MSFNTFDEVTYIDDVESEIVLDADVEDDNDVFDVGDSYEAVDCIEDMVTSFLHQLAFSGRSSFPQSKSRVSSGSESEETGHNVRNPMTKSKIELQLIDRRKETMLGSSNFKYIRYPRKCSKGSAKPLAQLFRVLDLAHEAIIDNMPVTKRDIYYRDIPLFKRQKVVDELVDDLAATFGLERSDLNIRAASKGLICGAGLIIRLFTGDVLQISDTEGTLIPVGEDIKVLSVEPDVSWVLIVEKEAVFQTLCRLRLTSHTSLPGRGLIITGKGYPDVATRHLVKTLADALPLSIPILTMVDGDPYGIDILSVYKYGSKNLQHEGTKLAAARVKWLGLWSSELGGFGIDRDALLPITKHDEQKAVSMLRRPPSTMPRKWRKELMHMLHSRRKAEIEILSTMKSDRTADDPEHSTLQSQNECDLTAIFNIPEQSMIPLDDYSTVLVPSDHTTASNLPVLLTATADSTSHTSSSQRLPSSSPIHLSMPQQAPLMRYLVDKITGFVFSAQARAKPTNA